MAGSGSYARGDQPRSVPDDRGKPFPNVVKNHPANITATRVAADHMRIHGRYRGQPQYEGPVQYGRGAPDWAKRAHVWIPTRITTAVDSQTEPRRK